MTGLAALRRRLDPGGPVIDAHVHPLDNFGGFPLSRPADDARRLGEAARREGQKAGEDDQVSRKFLHWLASSDPLNSRDREDYCRGPDPLGARVF